ncbi:hypothetical protein PVAND_008988 [Polypedilum vanderplanki]|uniref:Uncharacterized protein n=1 Tax=Polypedilum vanderplanki TaxID=319348 RepID=A0A9J6CBX3_POLVA|nr:hypothetical protein PVAND_008988 [Polypedilum vanderplanki]
MDLFLINNFLGFLSLETGGLIIGWFNIVLYTITILTTLFYTATMGLYKCDEINGFGFSTLTISECLTYKIVLTLSIIFLILIAVGLIVIYSLLIRGIQKREHKNIKPSVFIVAIEVILLIIKNLLMFTISGFFTAVFYGIIGGYIFAVVYSLYVKIRNEKLEGVYMNPV